MMKNSAFDIIKEKILVQEDISSEHAAGEATKKRKRTGGNAAVNTVAGANAVIALHQTGRRDNRLNEKTRAKKMNGLNTELKNIQLTLRLVQARRKRFDAMKVAANLEQAAVPVEENCPLPRIMTEQEFWQVKESEPQNELTLFLRLFLPTCGKLSKAKQEQWETIQSAVLPILTCAAFTAKVEAYERRSTAIVNELKEYEDDNEDTVANDN